MATTYRYEPVGLDVWDRRAHQPNPGDIVVKTKVPGAPPNGTMGHCYVKDAYTGEFRGLVLLASLKRVKMMCVHDGDRTAIGYASDES